MFRIKTPVLVDVMEDVWKRSARVAALSAVLAKRCGVFTSDRALLAGLLQDIGALPILNALDRWRPHREQRQQVCTVVEALSADIGAMLLLRSRGRRARGRGAARSLIPVGSRRPRASLLRSLNFPPSNGSDEIVSGVIDR